MSMGGDVAAGSQELALGHLAEAVNEGLRQGREPDVEQLVREHPALTESIRQLVPALVLLHHIGHEGDAKYEGGRSVAAETSCAGQLGDFQIIREIGRGGMGIVYEAEQLSLRRRVALKVLPFAAVLDQRQLRRFKNEAQAAALLHHQNIVPVHGVGCERGVHYYAMQYVEGQSLDHVIASMRTLGGFDAAPAASADPRGAPEPIVPAPRRASGQLQSKAHPLTPADATAAYSPAVAELSTSREIVGAALPTEHPAVESEHRQRTSPASATAREIKGFRSTERSCNQPAYFRSIAEVGIQVAEALEHAHVEGVVHRDIKPSNLILDSRGKVWVTDFGLARVETDCGLTKTGDLIGTLRYMSPEQALANRVIVDHRADIYSLGATLYELMTLEPVFGGQDRHELLRQIAFEEPRPPRRINSDVPQELETIVLKAMAKNPDERYAAAQELADDLNRFLDDKPIWAKPPTVMHRARKMARRHKQIVWTVGVSTALLMVLSIVGLAASNVWISRERDAKGAALREKADALTEASTQQQAAENARAEAVANLKTARQAVDQMLTRVGERRLADIPQMEQVRRELLEDALGFYQSFHQKHSNDPEIRLETALAHGRLGKIYAMLGRRVKRSRRCARGSASWKNCTLKLRSIRALASH